MRSRITFLTLATSLPSPGPGLGRWARLSACVAAVKCVWSADESIHGAQRAYQDVDPEPVVTKASIKLLDHENWAATSGSYSRPLYT